MHFINLNHFAEEYFFILKIMT